MPHLIGSKEWTDKWHIGLVESDDEDDDDEVANDQTTAATEEFSSSDDDTISMSVSLPSNVQTASENSDSRRSSRPSTVADNSIADGERIYDILRPQAEHIRPAVLQSSRTVVRPSNLFSGSDSDSEVNANDVATVHTSNAGRVNVNPETVKSTRPDAQRVRVLPTNTVPTAGARSKTASVKHIDAPAPIFNQQPQQQSHKPPASIGLFDDEPPELDAPVAAARRQPNLFLEDSDDDDNMLGNANVPVVAPQTSAAIVRTNNVPPKVSNLFDSTDDSEPEEYVPRPQKPQVPPSVQPTMAKSNISQLFDDSPPDDLFDVLISKKPAAANSDVKKKSIFDFDEDELFGSGRNVVVQSKKIETEQMSTNDDVLKPKNPVAVDAVVNKKSIFDFDEDELFSTGPNVVVPSKKIASDQKSTRTVRSIADTADLKKKSIFESDEDDLFDKAATSVDVPKNAASPTFSQSRTAKDERKPSAELMNKVWISENPNADDDPLFNKEIFVPSHSTSSSSALADDEMFGKPTKRQLAEIPSEPKSSARCVDDLAKSPAEQPTERAAQPQPLPVKTSSDIFDDIFGDTPSEDEFTSIFAKAKPSLRAPTSRKSLFDIPDDSEEWEPAKPTMKTATASLLTAFADDKHVKPISETNTSMTIGTADKPAMRIEPVASSKASTPEQCAQFYTADKSAGNGAKLVEDRRPFVSFLDNDTPSDAEDDWADGSSEVFAPVTIPDSAAVMDSNSSQAIENPDAVVKSAGADTKRNESEAVIATSVQSGRVIQHSLGIEIANSALITNQQTDDVVDKASEMNVPIVKARLANENMRPHADHLEPPPVDAVNETKSKSSAYLFDDEPPEDDFLSVPSKPVAKPSSQLNAAFFDTLPPDDDNEPFHRQPFSVDQTFGSTLGSSVALFDDLPPDDDDTLDIQVSQPSQLARTSAMAMFEDLPPDDVLFHGSNVSSTTVSTEKKLVYEDMGETIVTTEKKVFYEDFEETIVATVPKSRPPPITARVKSLENAEKTDTFKEKINRFAHAHSLDSSPELVQRKPNKLNCNLQINVAALLPGAKRAPTVTVAQPSDVDVGCQSDTNEVSSVPTNTRAAESSSGLLVGLTKGRARPTLKRNPSTRQGRLNGLEKSASFAESGTKYDEEDDVVEQKPTASIAELLKNGDDSDDVWLVSSKDTADTDELPPKVSAPIAELSNNDEADDWLNNDVPTPASVSTVQASGLFSDDDSDDLFGATADKRSLPNKNNESANQPPKVPLPKLTKNTIQTSSSLFGDTVDDDDDLFGAITRRSQKPAEPAPKSIRSLFGESDSDDDDLFGTSKPKKNTTGEWQL